MKVKITNETLEDWRRWLSRRKSAGTAEGYVWAVRQYFKFIRERGLKAGPKSVEEWLEEMEREGLAPSTINTRFYAVKSLFKFLGIGESLGRVSPPPVKYSHIDVYSVEDAWRIIEHTRDIAVKAALTVMLVNGLRIGEVLSMRIDDLFKRDEEKPPWQWEPAMEDESGPYLLVRREKVREGIYASWVPTQMEVVESAREWLKARCTNPFWGDLRNWKDALKPNSPSWLLFYKKDGMLSRSHIATTLRKTCGELGIKYLSPHKFRHTRITQIIAETGDIAAAKEFAGHASIQTTMRYLHLAPQTLRSKIPLIKKPLNKTEENGD